MGEHSYIIKYTYDIGKDSLKNIDELYYNLIGSEWNTDILNVNFKITMPKEFDENNVEFSSGYKGVTDNSNVSYNIYGNVIKGKIKGFLTSEEELTIRITLPEGYFVSKDEYWNTDTYCIIVIIISLLCVLIADRAWGKYGKDDEVIETVGFYPPEGYNSAEIGFFYKGKADEYSIISLLLYLANKGYLKIEEPEDKKKGSYIITKIKEYDGNNENERMFLDGLFRSKEKIGMEQINQIIYNSEDDKKSKFAKLINLIRNGYKKESVVFVDLYNRFYKTINKIEKNMNNKQNLKKIFEASADEKSKWIIIMILIILVLINIKPIIEFSITEQIGEEIFLCVGCVILSILSSIKRLFFESKKTVIKNMKFIFFLELAILETFILVRILPEFKNDFIFSIMYIIGIVCIAVLTLYERIMPKRTEYGNEMLGKIKGFKRFLQTAEKFELENLAKQNPEYFYNILPYTYALNVSNMWINKFETITRKAPKWYHSANIFDAHNFSEFLRYTMNYTERAMTSKPSYFARRKRRRGLSGGGSRGVGGEVHGNL